MLLKIAIVAIGLAGGLLISVRPRAVRFTAPVAVAVWAVGFGWLIVDTMA
jgi:hypothetical protein